jgi:hypothetical protein
MRNGLLHFVLGALAALLWVTARRDEKRAEMAAGEARYSKPVSGTSSRTPAQMSPAFKAYYESDRRLEDYSADELASLYHQVFDELIQPEMTEHEAAQVRDQLTSLAIRGLTHEEMHRLNNDIRREHQAENWLSDVEEGLNNHE